MKAPRKTRRPWHPAATPDSVVYALKALSVGKASAGQQKAALEWIVLHACGTLDETFHPGAFGVDGAQVSAYLQGRRNVGIQITTIIGARLGPNIPRYTAEGVPIEKEPEE